MSIRENVLKMDFAKHNPNTANYLQKYKRTLNNLKLATAPVNIWNKRTEGAGRSSGIYRTEKNFSADEDLLIPGVCSAGQPTRKSSYR